MKYKRAARKRLSTMKKWTKAENPNTANKLLLLEAENFALKRNKEEAVTKYENSISTSIQCGFVQDAAIACERYGEYLLNEINDEEKATHHFTMAVDFYDKWGALAKVHQLNEKYLS